MTATRRAWEVVERRGHLLGEPVDAHLCAFAGGVGDDLESAWPWFERGGNSGAGFDLFDRGSGEEPASSLLH